jgi:hypothetical protein
VRPIFTMTVSPDRADPNSGSSMSSSELGQYRNHHYVTNPVLDLNGLFRFSKVNSESSLEDSRQDNFLNSPHRHSSPNFPFNDVFHNGFHNGFVLGQDLVSLTLSLRKEILLTFVPSRRCSLSHLRRRP